jgi:TPR repeat protein
MKDDRCFATVEMQPIRKTMLAEWRAGPLLLCRIRHIDLRNLHPPLLMSLALGTLLLLVAGCNSLQQGGNASAAGRYRYERGTAAAEDGDAKAQYELGCYYASGIELATNHTEAVKWWRKSAEQGYAPAQNNLGVCYTEGLGVTPDYGLAMSWFRKAAEQNDAQGQCNLGICYDKGQGVVKDKAEAVRWYQKAARGGAPKAFNNLAWILATSDDPAIRNGPSALSLAKKGVAATERKNPSALDTLAAAYAASGEFEKAVNAELEAIALLTTEATTKRADYTSRLNLYQAKTPYRARD